MNEAGITPEKIVQSFRDGETQEWEAVMQIKRLQTDAYFQGKLALLAEQERGMKCPS